MTTPKRTLDVWVAYDNDGDYVVGTDREATIEEYAHEFGGTNEPIRVVNLQLRVPAVVDVEAEIDVPEENARVTVR